jgi:phospholipase C
VGGDDARPRLTRRAALRGAVASGLALGACSTGRHRPTAPTRTAARTATPSSAARPLPGSLPRPDLPAGTDTLPQIEHIVVVTMENHSFDNYFGMLGRGDGFTLDGDGRPTAANADAAGNVVHAFRMPTTCQLPRRPSQAWNASHTQWDGGRNDGFVRSQSGPVAMGYWTGDDLPFYYGLARTFPVADRWFASCLAPTYPNRRFLLAGTALGWVSDPTPSAHDPVPPNGTVFDQPTPTPSRGRTTTATSPRSGSSCPP